MTIGTPYALASGNSAAGSNMLQVTVAATSAAGDALIVAAAANTVASQSAPSACQDSQGNVYTRMVTTGINAEYQTSIFVATESSTGGPTTPLVNGVDTITITYTTSTAATGHNLLAIGCPGLGVGPASSTVDQTAFNGNATTGTVTTATLPATAKAGELVVAAVSAHNTATSITWNSPLVAVAGPVVNGGNEQTFIAAGVSATTASTTYGGTISATGKWDCAVISLLPLTKPSGMLLAMFP